LKIYYNFKILKIIITLFLRNSYNLQLGRQFIEFRIENNILEVVSTFLIMEIELH